MASNPSSWIGPLRIINKPSAFGGGPKPAAAGIAKYSEKLALMAPSEVTAFYVSTHPFVVGNLTVAQLRGDFAAWVPWICVGLVIVVKALGTRGKTGWSSVQLIPVAFATIAFVLWVLTMGHYMAILSDWSIVQNSRALGFIAALFTFGVPYFYKGSPPDRPEPAGGAQGGDTHE